MNASVGLIRKAFISVIAIFSMMFMSLSANAAEDLIIGWYDWSPHQMKDASGKLTGVNIELMEEISNRAGFKPRFQEKPWKRIVEELKQGKVDVATSASKTDERAKFAYFTEDYFKLEYNVMFVLKENKDKFSGIKTLTDVIGKNFNIGITRGSIYSDEHDELAKNPEFNKHISPVGKAKQNLEKLLAGRIDGFIEDELSGAKMIKEAGLEGKIEILFYLYSEEYASAYLMLSKKSLNQAKVDRINKALAEIKADGTYEKILSKYQL